MVLNLHNYFLGCSGRPFYCLVIDILLCNLNNKMIRQFPKEILIKNDNIYNKQLMQFKYGYVEILS